MVNRRNFLSQISKASVLASLPLPIQDLFAQRPTQDTIIDSVSIVRVSGPWTSTPGLSKQYQVQPNFIYQELRPVPYSDKPGTPSTGTITHDYIRITTKGGLEGFYGHLDPETVTPIMQQLRPFLIGKDALAIEALWDQLYRNNRHSRAGQYMMALSAVDNCLWDLRGKYFKVPVYELLGGATRKEVRVYGSCLGYSVEKGKVGPQAKKLFDQGFINQKWFMAYGPGDGPAGLRKSIEMVQELRESVPDLQMMFDAFMGWDLPFATQWCKEVEKYRPYWIEEAFAPDRPELFTQLASQTSIPIATGEHFYSRWEVQNFLKEKAIQIVQADPEWCGGVSELVKICHLASSYGVKVFPHGHNIHSQLHVVASQSPEVCPLVEYLILHVPNKLNFQKDPLLTSNGIIPLPTKPGFGIELDSTKVEKMEVIKV
jgi:L-alanine-DL-glutamate epimerase-like enolase superfamily enzyme